MKAGLILKIIEAHCGGSEDDFKNAVSALANDEERKGNTALADSLLKAYSGKKKYPLAGQHASDFSFSLQSVYPTPKDKDSALELVEMQHPKISLKDVALPDKIRNILNQIIKEQQQADSLAAKGIQPSNRLLLCGPPGCGKTLTANALAGELDIPVAYVKLDALVSSYLGQTGTNIRKIFEFVKNKRVLLFLDEFDAIAKKRDDAHELGELKRVVTTLLQNMDAMPSNVLLIAATNHHHLLDSAIWRRFDSSILFDLPSSSQRIEIIDKFVENVFSEFTLPLDQLVSLTEGMSGAQVCGFMQSLAKFYFLNGSQGNNISIADIAGVWLKHMTLFSSEESESFSQALRTLNQKGISIRTLERITGIPKSTLSYRFNQEMKIDE